MWLYKDAYLYMGRQWEHNLLPTLGEINNWQLCSWPLKCYDIAQRCTDLAQFCHDGTVPLSGLWWRRNDHSHAASFGSDCSPCGSWKAFVQRAWFLWPNRFGWRGTSSCQWGCQGGHTQVNLPETVERTCWKNHVRIFSLQSDKALLGPCCCQSPRQEGHGQDRHGDSQPKLWILRGRAGQVPLRLCRVEIFSWRDLDLSSSRCKILCSHGSIRNGEFFVGRSTKNLGRWVP